VQGADALIRPDMRMLRTRSSGSLGRTQEMILHFHEVSAAIIARQNKEHHRLHRSDEFGSKSAAQRREARPTDARAGATS